MDENYPRVVCNSSLLLLDGTRVKRRIFGPAARVPPIDMDCPISCKRSIHAQPPVALDAPRRETSCNHVGDV